MKALKSHEKMTHFHRTYIFEGDEEALVHLAGSLIGVKKEEIHGFINAK